MTEATPSVSDPWIWLAVGLALVGGYWSCLQLSLDDFTRSELEEQPDSAHRSQRIDWLYAHLDESIVATSLWRWFAAVGFIVTVMVAAQRAAPSNTTSTAALVWSAVICLAWLWLVNVGLSRAIAQHAGSAVVARSLRWLPALCWVSRPMAMPVALINETVRRLVGAEDRDDLEDDLLQVMEESEREGHLGETEKEMIHAIVDFRTCTVGEIMTPRIDIEGIRLTDDLAAVKQRVLDEGHSRYPVYIESLDQIEGVLYAKDLITLVGQDASAFRLQPLLRKAILVPESRRISDLLIEFQKKQVHMAIVIDEYGGTAGLVTIEDIVEEIVGEIRDEHEVDEPDSLEIEMLDDGSALVDGRVRVDELNDELGLDLPEDADFDTAAGWVLATAGRIPDVGEVFQIDGTHVTVLQVDRTRLQRLKIAPLDRSPNADSPPDNGSLPTNDGA